MTPEIYLDVLIFDNNYETQEKAIQESRKERQVELCLFF